MSTNVFGRHRVLAWAACALLFGLTACDRSFGAGPSFRAFGASPGPERVKLPDGRRINLLCTGRGTPTVLLEGGYAADHLAWTKVQQALQTRFRTCSYDRAGYGESDRGPLPRDGEAIAADLVRTLDAADVRGPFIVVGHSSGALYARLFAARTHGQVVGLVLADPSLADQQLRFAEVFGAGAGNLDPLRRRAVDCLAASDSGDKSLPKACGTVARPGFWQAEISELDNLWPRTGDEVRQTRAQLARVPAIVLTATRTFPDPRVQQVWNGLHDELAARFAGGVNRQVDSSHLMPIERPDAIVAAVKEIAARPRSRRASAKQGHRGL